MGFRDNDGKLVGFDIDMRDCREVHDREVALVSVVATGEKTIVYVNSREQSVTLARMRESRASRAVATTTMHRCQT